LSKEPSESTNNQKGKEGETIAENYLLSHGYAILERNYRFGKAEIDLIAQKDSLLVFVEVKLRKHTYFGYPEEFVEKAQMTRIKNAAMEYVFEKNWLHDIRFDIVSIVKQKDTIDLVHLNDCF
jgi:putative endonuclease